MSAQEVTLIQKWERGLAFCDYLQSDRVRDEQWSFSKIVTSNFQRYLRKYPSAPTKNFCGTIGCAIAHLPIWEQSKEDGWRFSINDVTTIKVVSPDGYLSTAIELSKYFGISEDDAWFIFISADRYGRLFDAVTQHDVARRLRDTINKCKLQAVIALVEGQ